jgi:bacterial/archaeal transporter family-2 protein
VTYLRDALGSALIATIINFFVGLVALGGLAPTTGARVAPGSLPSVPAWAWAWLGGLLGATYVAAATVLGPRRGAAAFLAFPESPINPWRVIGVVLLIGVVVLMMRR